MAKGTGTYRNYDWMYERYVVREMSPKKVAEEAGCNPSTIGNWLNKHGIHIRNLSEAQAAGKIYRDRAWFEKHWIILSTSRAAMAKIAGCWETTIRDWRIKHGFSPRPRPPVSPETKAKIAKAVTGHRHSPKTRAKMSRSQKGRVHPPEVRAKISRTHKLNWTEERRCALSKRTKKSWDESPERKRMLSEKQKEYWTEERRKESSDRMKKRWANGVYDDVSFSTGRATSIEIATRNTLKTLSMEYVEQWSPPDLRRRYDFCLPFRKILIEVHGDHFHNYNHFPAQFTSDKEKRVWAEENGYDLIVIWEHDINRMNTEFLVKRELMTVFTRQILEGRFRSAES